MAPITFEGKTYEVDAKGFILDSEQWDEGFARAIAPTLEIKGGLTEEHWRIITFIRAYLVKHRTCPLVYETCHANGLFLRELQRLFPTGYLRGACKLAGVSYRDRFINYFGEESDVSSGRAAARASRQEKSYLTNAAGFLIDSTQWDDTWAVNKAAEIGLKNGITPEHWKIIRFLRSQFDRTGKVPTLYETCEANNLELDALEKLFPQGYQRGAVKIAGLWAV